MDLGPIRDRIQNGTDLMHVGDVVEAADAIQNVSAPTPSAFVSTAREQAAKNKNSTGRHSQMVDQTISVLVAEGAQRADSDLRDVVEARKEELITLLMGWTPDGASLPLDYVSYSIRFMDQGIVWFELLFSTRFIRSTVPAD